jgi:ABC-type lipopolysaccharide export system ATPase subunit
LLRTRNRGGRYGGGTGEKCGQGSDEHGKSKGKLTTSEINEHLKTGFLTLEQVDQLYEKLESYNVEIVEEFTRRTSKWISRFRRKKRLKARFRPKALISTTRKSLSQGNRARCRS